MRLNFGDKSVVLTYLQIKLKEQYNSKIIVNGEYYTQYNNNYGFAHFIAKYLNMMYPPLNTGDYNTNISKDNFNNQKEITDCISIMNYFLSDNHGNKLTNDFIIPSKSTETSVFRQIYGNDLGAIFNVNDTPLITSYNDLFEQVNNKYIVNPAYHLESLDKKIQNLNKEQYINTIADSERIYNLSEWSTEKQICEIDNLVLSYLLGRTITPNSSHEDIYYVQQLMLGSNINIRDRGIWNSSSGNLTEIITDYQKSKVNPYTTNPLFVTGYFDIFTESSILKDRGDRSHGIYGI